MSDKDMDHLRLDGIMQRNPDVIDRRLDHAAVLVNIVTNRIFELNETAARVWELIGQGVDQAGIVRHLVEEFEVEKTQAEDEVNNLLRVLKSEGLLAG